MRLAIAIFFCVPTVALGFPVPKAAQTPSIAGTTWSGDGIVGPTRYTFNADGTMTYSYSAATHKTATWKQDGAKIYWECNNKYCEFEGTLEGKEIRGKTWNIKDFRKELKITKEGE